MRITGLPVSVQVVDVPVMAAYLMFITFVFVVINPESTSSTTPSIRACASALANGDRLTRLQIPNSWSPATASLSFRPSGKRKGLRSSHSPALGNAGNCWRRCLFSGLYHWARLSSPLSSSLARWSRRRGAVRLSKRPGDGSWALEPERRCMASWGSASSSRQFAPLSQE
jgi:hypothetical protein